jgi:hypothetical protein
LSLFFFKISPYVSLGNLSLSAELRLRTCVEMMINKRRYLMHSSAAEITEQSSDFDEAIANCAKTGGYSGPWTIAALASVVRRRISPNYPNINGPDDPFSQIGNMSFDPIQGYHMTVGTPLYILWTRTIPHIGVNWAPNHFVPLYEPPHSAGSSSVSFLSLFVGF